MAPPKHHRHLTLDSIADLVANEIESTIPNADIEESDQEPLWAPLEPQPGRGIRMPDGRLYSPQRMAYESPADELFFGGAGGGGKTDLGIGLALTAHRNSIIFRSQFTQLKGAEGIIERSRQIIGLQGDLNRTEWVWRNLPGFRTLEFGGCGTEEEREKWRGRPHDLKVFDEVPEIPWSVYRFLIGWLRTTVIGQRCRVLATGNPPSTAEGQWVLDYWGPWLRSDHPNPAPPGELRWFAVLDEKDVEVPGPTLGEYLAGRRSEPVKDPKSGHMTWPRSRTFIPARVEDNPYYMATGYDRVLDGMPEPLRSQLRFGNFGAVSRDDEWQVIPTAWVIAAQNRWTPLRPSIPLTCVGNDPARGGDDSFVIAKRYGWWVDRLERYNGVVIDDGVKGAAKVYESVGGDTEVPIQIDVIGSAGSSVYDQCKQLKLRAIAMNGSERAVKVEHMRIVPETDKSGKLTFANKRAMWHWRLRELLDPSSGADIALPPDPKLRADLCAPRWYPTPRGVRVEEKSEIKARIGRSPDDGDAVINACADDWVRMQGPKMPLVLW